MAFDAGLHLGAVVGVHGLLPEGSQIGKEGNEAEGDECDLGDVVAGWDLRFSYALSVVMPFSSDNPLDSGCPTNANQA